MKLNLKSSAVSSLFDFFYPRACAACNMALNSREQKICYTCRFSLPRTNFHLLAENDIEKIFWGRVPVKAAASYYYFNKNSKVQKLLHSIKYRGNKDAAVTVGKWYGSELKKSERFNNVDIIIPVPLFAEKQKKRGFNQSEYFGKGIAHTLGAELITNNLVRIINSETQTRKARYKRWQNVESVFYINDTEAIKGKTILLIDDVITTGATLEACAQELLKHHGVKIKVASLAFTLQR